MPGGRGNIRPSDGKPFSSEYQPDKEIWTESVAIQFCQDLIDWLKSEEENIFYEEFIFIVADPKKYHPKAKIYAELPAYLAAKFSRCLKLLEKATKIQEVKLQKYSTFDKLNPTMTKFVLINKHGWEDKSKSEQTTTHKGEPRININIEGKPITLE